MLTRLYPHESCFYTYVTPFEFYSCSSKCCLDSECKTPLLLIRLVFTLRRIMSCKVYGVTVRLNISHDPNFTWVS